MLKGNRTVEEIVEFFRTYQMEGGFSLEPRVYRQKSGSSSRQSSVEPEPEDLGDKLSLKVKTRDIADEITSNNGREKSNECINDNKNKSKGSQNKMPVVDLKNRSDPRDLNKNLSSKTNQDCDSKDTTINAETITDTKERELNVTEMIQQSLSNLDNMVRNVETEIVDLSTLREGTSCESDQGVTKLNFHENKSVNNHNTAEKSAARNVFDLVDADYIKRMIPFMHPKSRNHTFKYFLGKVDEVVETVGKDKLLNADILDIMQFRYN